VLILKRIFLSLCIFFFSAQMGEALGQPIAIVVNKNNPIEDISPRELTKIFKKEKLFWPDSTKIYVILREAGSEEKDVALKTIYKMNNQQLKKFWITQIFREEITAFPKVLRSDASIKRFIKTVPNAIGFINANSIDQSVKVLKIDGKLPNETGYIIKK